MRLATVVAAMRRQAQPGEFRSNLHRGGTAEAIKITPEERATAVQAAKIMGLDVAGVDILRSARGPLVLWNGWLPQYMRILPYGTLQFFFMEKLANMLGTSTT
jgi:hypothetical protein